MLTQIQKVKDYGLANSLAIFLNKIFLRRNIDINYLKYRKALKQDQVYFGAYLSASQGSHLRRAHMEKLVELECQGKSSEVKILEIGSWAGGSAILWAKALTKYNEGKGNVFCIDPFTSYIDLKKVKGTETLKKMEAAIASGEIFELFLHNIRASGCGSLISFLRGFSHEILQLFKPEQFDIIYVDGDHAYESVLSDLKTSALLLKEEGVLCGDDLELQVGDVDIAFAKEHLQDDWVASPKGEFFHPGVTAAVYDFFQKPVSSFDGFWAMRKKNKCWEDLKL